MVMKDGNSVLSESIHFLALLWFFLASTVLASAPYRISSTARLSTLDQSLRASSGNKVSPFIYNTVTDRVGRVTDGAGSLAAEVPSLTVNDTDVVPAATPDRVMLPVTSSMVTVAIDVS